MAGLLAAASLLAVDSGAAVGDQVGVVIGYPGAEVLIGKQEIAAQADVAPRDYTLRATPGATGETDTHSGVSVRKLIQLAGSNPDQFGFLTVPRADGTTAFLPASDFSDPPPFPEGPALIWVDQASTHFFRPVRNGSDANAADNIATVSGDPLPIGLHAGNILSVRAQSSSSHVRAGKPVRLSASVSGERAGEQLSYRWTFGDGSFAGDQTNRHVFKRRGSYRILVTVTGSRDSGGESPPLSVVVGNPPTKGHRGAGHGGGSNGASQGTGTGSGTGSGSGGGGSGGGAIASASAAGGTSQPQPAAGSATHADTNQAHPGALDQVAGVLVPGLSRPAQTVSGAQLLDALTGSRAGGESSTASAESNDASSSGANSATIWSVAGLAALFLVGAGLESRKRLGEHPA
jgi:hypothetical protein